jgi:acyl-CoA synthetase (AMP-forming)/AMP-acid ligase II
MIRSVRFSSSLTRAISRAFSSNNKFVLKSPLECPELHSDLAKTPLPLFVMKDFLKPERINATASVCGLSEREYTFGQSYYASHSFADSLKDFGFKRGDCIAIMSPNCLYYFPAFMGIALTGATSSCINPLYAEAEVNYQLETTQSKAILVHPICLERVLKATQGKKIKIIVMDEGYTVDAHIVENHGLLMMSSLFSTETKKPKYDHNKEILNGFDPHSIATLPFSSGTTGRSKGVMLTHHSLISNVLQWIPSEGKHLLPTKTKPRATMLVPLPYFHLYGFYIGLLCSHYVGSRVVFMPSFDLARFLELIQKYKVTRTYLVPPIILALAKHPMVANYDLSTLEAITCAAAPLGSDIQDACAKRLKCVVKQAWGMTELSPIGTATLEEMLSHSDDGSSGVLVAGTEAKIIHTETGEDIDPAKEGELLIRGPQVMKGYLNNPEATAHTITPDGWLKTGDIGCFDAQGRLFIKDRKKELIKYKGFQVPPAELEAIIATMPEVKDVIVIPVLDEEAGEIPRAYVVKQDNCRADFCEQDVLEFVQNQVAPYKRLRGGVVFTNAVPKSPSGKLLRRVQIEIDRQTHQHDLPSGKKNT